MTRGRTKAIEPESQTLLSSPRILLGRVRSAYIGPGLQLEPHKMAVATVVVGLEKPFHLAFFGKRSALSKADRLGLIPPDTLHHLKSQGAMLFLYLDPIGEEYRSIDPFALVEKAEQKADSLREYIIASPDISSANMFLSQLNEKLGIEAAHGMDMRIARTLQAIEAAPADFDTIEHAASIAGLSVSRFQHVFRDSVGTTFRRYRIWQRMRVVAKTLVRGENLTTAAYDAGFSSSAHLSTAFKAMFGLSPSDLLKGMPQILID